LFLGDLLAKASIQPIHKYALVWVFVPTWRNVAVPVDTLDNTAKSVHVMELRREPAPNALVVGHASHQMFAARAVLIMVAINVNFHIVLESCPMIPAFVVTDVVPASHQMFVLRVLQDMVEVNVNSQFVMENLPILLRFVMVEMEHVCYQMFVRRVLQDMEEVNVKFQFVLVRWRIAPLYATTERGRVQIPTFVLLAKQDGRELSVRKPFVMESRLERELNALVVELVLHQMFVQAVIQDGLDRCAKMQFVQENKRMIQRYVMAMELVLHPTCAPHVHLLVRGVVHFVRSHSVMENSRMTLV
jgi:hypothetical protein